MGTKRFRNRAVVALTATILGVAAGLAPSALAAGPPIPHGTGNVGDDNAGQGAQGEVGNIGGCISTHAGVVSVTQSPFNTFDCQGS